MGMGDHWLVLANSIGVSVPQQPRRFNPELEARIRAELQDKGRSTPVFEFGFYRTDGILCIVVTNTVRPKGYRSQQGAYTAPKTQ